MNIALCDDDKTFEEKFTRHIYEFCENKKIECSIDFYQSGERLLDNIMEYDVVFLDVEMPEMNGFEVADRINLKNEIMTVPRLVFITNYDNMIWNALKKRPLYFVRKSNLKNDISDFFDVFEKEKTLGKINELRYPVKDSGRIYYLNIDNIFYIDRDGNYTVFHMENNTVFRERSRVAVHIEKLINYGFTQIAKCCLVKTKKIVEMSKEEIKLENGTVLSVASKYKQQTSEAYFDYIRSNVE